MADYAKVQANLGFTRVVVVQPTGYGFDNRCTLAAVASMAGQARAVAMVPPTVTQATLQDLHAAGVRGVRMMMLPGGLLGWDALAPLALKIKDWGWHLNVQFNGCDFTQRLPLLQGLNVPLVVDHTGKFLVPPASTDDVEFQALCRLLDTGRVWVKLSAPYETSRTGAPCYEDVSLLARYLATNYPERCLWASNWPHPNQNPVPSSVALLNLLPQWVSRTADIRRILFDNPAHVYGFDA
jgi:D-galactarolactone isomerase